MDFLTWHHLTHQNPPKRGRMEAGCFQVLILGAKNLKTLRRFPKGEFIETGLVLCSLKAKPQKLKMQPPPTSPAAMVCPRRVRRRVVPPASAPPRLACPRPAASPPSSVRPISF